MKKSGSHRRRRRSSKRSSGSGDGGAPRSTTPRRSARDSGGYREDAPIVPYPVSSSGATVAPLSLIAPSMSTAASQTGLNVDALRGTVAQGTQLGVVANAFDDSYGGLKNALLGLVNYAIESRGLRNQATLQGLNLTQENVVAAARLVEQAKQQQQMQLGGGAAVAGGLGAFGTSAVAPGALGFGLYGTPAPTRYTAEMLDKEVALVHKGLGEEEREDARVRARYAELPNLRRMLEETTSFVDLRDELLRPELSPALIGLAQGLYLMAESGAEQIKSQVQYQATSQADVAAIKAKIEELESTWPRTAAEADARLKAEMQAAQQQATAAFGSVDAKAAQLRQVSGQYVSVLRNVSALASEVLRKIVEKAQAELRREGGNLVRRQRPPLQAEQRAFNVALVEQFGATKTKAEAGREVFAGFAGLQSKSAQAFPASNSTTPTNAKNPVEVAACELVAGVATFFVGLARRFKGDTRSFNIAYKNAIGGELRVYTQDEYSEAGVALIDFLTVPVRSLFSSAFKTTFFAKLDEHVARSAGLGVGSGVGAAASFGFGSYVLPLSAEAEEERKRKSPLFTNPFFMEYMPPATAVTPENYLTCFRKVHPFRFLVVPKLDGQSAAVQLLDLTYSTEMAPSGTTLAGTSTQLYTSKGADTEVKPDLEDSTDIRQALVGMHMDIAVLFKRSLLGGNVHWSLLGRVPSLRMLQAASDWQTQVLFSERLDVQDLLGQDAAERRLFNPLSEPQQLLFSSSAKSASEAYSEILGGRESTATDKVVKLLEEMKNAMLQMVKDMDFARGVSPLPGANAPGSAKAAKTRNMVERVMIAPTREDLRNAARALEVQCQLYKKGIMQA